MQESVYSQEVVDVKFTDFKGDQLIIAYTQDVINSCKTDIEILKAASNIIGLLLSSNQYIAIRV